MLVYYVLSISKYVKIEWMCVKMVWFSTIIILKICTKNDDHYVNIFLSKVSKIVKTTIK